MKVGVRVPLALPFQRQSPIFGPVAGIQDLSGQTVVGDADGHPGQPMAMPTLLKRRSAPSADLGITFHGKKFHGGAADCKSVAFTPSGFDSRIADHFRAAWRL